MNRREFVALIGSALAAPLVPAQMPPKRPTLGLLYPNPSAGGAGTALDFFATRLKELGWIVGQNLIVENASAEGREERLPALAKALVEKRVDVIWAAGPEAVLAAARATKTIPITFYGVGYPVEQGLTDSLAKPGRNVTGLASIAGSEPQKAMELLHDVVPGRVKLSWIRVETAIQTLAGDVVRLNDAGTLTAAAGKLGLTIRIHNVSKPEDFEDVFKQVVESGAQLLGAQFTALTWRERHRIAEFGNQRRLPSCYGASDFVEAGGLLSYGANRLGMLLQSFSFVDRILRGATPAELPVELPNRFEFVVNKKTAKALGLTIPQSVLIRADRVIE